MPCARAFLGKRYSLLSKQIHKWNQDGEEEEEEGIEIILPEIRFRKRVLSSKCATKDKSKP